MIKELLELLIIDIKLFRSTKGMTNVLLGLIIMAIVLVIGTIFLVSRSEKLGMTFDKIVCILPGARCE